MPRVAAWIDAPSPPPLAPTRSVISVRSFRSASSFPSASAQPLPSSWSVAWLWGYLVQVWEGMQVSRRGELSGARLQALNRYMEATPRWRIVVVLLLTPLPSLLFVLAIHLIPLKPTRAGWHDNAGYSVGLALNMIVIAQSFVTQLSHVVPELPIPTRHTLAISFLGTLVTISLSFLVSAVWVFPVPFGIVLFSPVFAASLFAFTMAIVGDDARRRLPKLRTEVIAYSQIMGCQSLLSIIYPAYNAVYVGLNSSQQAVFVIVPSIIKFFIKNLLFNACAGLRLDDELPELMIFSADLFSALYLSACMQTVGTSTLTTIVIISLGNIQLVLAVRNLLKRGKHIRWLLRQMPVPMKKRGLSKASPYPQSNERLTSIAVRMCLQNGHRSSIARAAPSGTSATVKPLVFLPQHQIQSVLPNSVSSEAQERLVRQVLKTLFTCEYILLAEYVKCVIPLLSCIHTVVLYFMPAREYFGYMHQYKDTEMLYRAVQEVLLFTTLQTLSFVAMWLVLRRQLRHSVFFHLAFVLEHNREMIQLRLLTWVSYAFVLSIAHGGVDFTFQFEWMKKP